MNISNRHTISEEAEKIIQQLRDEGLYGRYTTNAVIIIPTKICEKFGPVEMVGTWKK